MQASRKKLLFIGTGGTVGGRFNQATVTDLTVGVHTMQFLYRRENGTIVCFEPKTFEVINAS